MRGCITGFMLLISGAALAGTATHGTWQVELSKDAFSDEPRSVMYVDAKDQYAAFGYVCQNGLAEVRIVLPWIFNHLEPIDFAIRANDGVTVTSSAAPLREGQFFVAVSNPKLISEVLQDGEIVVRVWQGGIGGGRDFRFFTSGTLAAATAFFEGCGLDLPKLAKAD
jgi:hypothetical protein